jgi:hypothetical protein
LNQQSGKAENLRNMRIVLLKSDEQS